MSYARFKKTPTYKDSHGTIYLISVQVLDQFLQHPIDSKEDLVEAYLVGNRLCRFLSNVLPTHPDYWSSDPEIVANRTKSHSQLVELMYFVKQLAVMIDEDEHQSYISRVLDSSTDNAARHIPSSLPLPSHKDKANSFESERTPQFPEASDRNSRDEIETGSEARDPSLNLNEEESLGSEENFDEMWAKVAPTTENASQVRTTRPMKNPSREGSGLPLAESSTDAVEWHSFSEDMSWTKMSLSVSSSKFQSAAEEQRRRADFRPPQVVKSKRKKKKSKRQDLPPIEDAPDEAQEELLEASPPLPETQLEKRLRRAQRNLENIQNGNARYEEDYPAPPESDYRGLPSTPPRPSPLDSPTHVLEDWSTGWDDWEKHSRDVSVDDTKVSLMTDTEKSIDDSSRKSFRLTRRQRAMKGLKCVKCLIE